MKKLFTLAAIALSLSATAQINIVKSDTTVIGKDTIISAKGSALILPVIVTVQGDSAWSLTWRIDGIQRDSTQDSYGQIYLFGKSGNRLSQDGFVIPAYIINNWVGNNYIDDFIFRQKKRFKKR